MSLSPVPLTPIERGYLHVMRIRRARFPGLLLIAALVADFADLITLPDWLPQGSFIVVAVLYALWRVGISPAREWRRWGYHYSGRELHVGQGWLVRYHTIVPVSRVQHIDVAQSMVERWFDVATLVLHTAGSEASAVALPGILVETAEEIRDDIRARIGAEA